MATKIKFKRKLSGSSADIANAVLEAGEPLFDTTTNTLYVGSDGNTEKTVNITGNASTANLSKSSTLAQKASSVNLVDGKNILLNDASTAKSAAFVGNGDNSIETYYFQKGKTSIISGHGDADIDAKSFIGLHTGRVESNDIYPVTTVGQTSAGNIGSSNKKYSEAYIDNVNGNLNGTATNATNLMISGKAYAATVSGSTLTLTPVTTTTQSAKKSTKKVV